MEHLSVSRRSGRILQIAFCALSGLLILPSTQAAVVIINLGQSAQNETLTGLGANGSGLGQYALTFGNCNPLGGNTTCVLSGTFTGNAPGLTGGTYNLVTTYAGTGTSPLQGTQQSAGSNNWFFSAIPATAVMNLTLVSANGTTTVATIFSQGQFLNGAAIAFAYGNQVSCTIVTTCTVSAVGSVAGATISGPPTAAVSFDTTLAQTSNKYYFSDFAYSGGYQTTLTYVNYSTQSVTCTTNFCGDNGLPVSVPFSDQSGPVRTDTMPPGGSLHVQTIAPLAPPFAQGWAQASCSGPVQAGMLFRYFSNGVAVGEASVNAEVATVPTFATFAQTATGIAYANPVPKQTAVITIAAYNTAGVKLGSKDITLGPLQHGTANVGPLLNLTTFTGFVKVTSNIPIIALSLNAEAFPVFSSLPPGDLPNTTTSIVP
jgi:hypothetical protein